MDEDRYCLEVRCNINFDDLDTEILRKYNKVLTYCIKNKGEVPLDTKIDGEMESLLEVSINSNDSKKSFEDILNDQGQLESLGRRLAWINNKLQAEQRKRPYFKD